MHSLSCNILKINILVFWSCFCEVVSRKLSTLPRGRTRSPFVLFPKENRPGLLEAWLVLTSVKYHGNLYILIPLNQRLALTRLRATGPWSVNSVLTSSHHHLSLVACALRKNVTGSTYVHNEITMFILF